MLTYNIIMKPTVLQKQIDDLDKLIEKLESELAQRQRDLETAKRFRDALPRLTNTKSSSKGKPLGVQTELGLNGKREYGTTTAAIRSAIEGCPSTYDIYDIEKVLDGRDVHIPRLIISQILSRLARTKKLKIKRRGKGRRPTIFTKDAANEIFS
jgi:hypothetical protein